jgi:chromosome segregation ATPase
VLAEKLVAKASEEFHLKLADVQKAGEEEGLEAKGDIARLEMALNGSAGRMRLLENALEEAREEGRKTKGEMAHLERQVNDATEKSCQRALLQLRLATAEKGIEASEAALNESRAQCAKFVDRVRELETALAHHEAVFARKLQRGQAALNQSRSEVAQLEERLEEAEATNS